MQYYDEPLGATVEKDTSIPEAVRMGAVEGISDTAKYLTLGMIALAAYAVIPKGTVKKFLKEAGLQ
jgi:hypothetical protein